MGRTRFAQNDLARLSYEVDGLPDGPPIVFLHATLGDHRTIGDLQDYLCQTYRLILPDARGHGASAALNDRSFTVTDMANDVWAVLELEGFDQETAPPLVILGHGQGAVTALELARRRSDRIGGMILIEPDTPSLLDGETDGDVIMTREAAREVYRKITESAYRDQVDQALEGYMRYRWGADWREELSRARVGAIRRHAASLGPSIDALDRFRILPDELREMPMPIHVMTAGSSPAMIEVVGRRLASAVPDASYRQIGKIALGAPFGSETMYEVIRPLIGSMSVHRRGR